jgi:hypothetical protein
MRIPAEPTAICVSEVETFFENTQEIIEAGSGASLTEREFVEGFLAVVNGDKKSDLIGLLYGIRTSVPTAFKSTDGSEVLTGAQLMDRYRPALRPRVVESLNQIVERTSRERERFAAWAQRLSGSLVIVPHYDVHDHKLVVRHQVICYDVGSAMRYGFALILDDSRPYGRALCRCRLESCRRFFFEVKPETGRPQRLYCLQDHMLEAQALRGADRVRKHRAKKKARKPR